MLNTAMVFAFLWLGLVNSDVDIDRVFEPYSALKHYKKVGLTMKSIDYLENGLPLINNIAGDTSNFVNEYLIGFNYINTDSVVEQLVNLTQTEYEEMSLASRKTWEKYLSWESNIGALEKIIDGIEVANENK